MKVSLVKQPTILRYARKHAEAKNSCLDWIYKVKKADWDMPDDMKHTFGSVDILGQGSQRAVFNIGGNNHRLICKYRFGENVVRLFVQWIGTHAEYTELCDKGEQYTAETFKNYT